MKNISFGLLVGLLALAFIAGACDKVTLSQEQPTSPAASWNGPAR